MDFKYTMEQRIFADSVRGLSERHFSKKAFTWFGKFPWENLKILAENDLLGLIIPVEDGGQGGKLIDCVIAILEISRVDTQTADVFHIGNLGAMHQLALFGNEYLKKEVLPKLLKGETIISACMSEPNVGSSVSDLQTTAKIEGDEVAINGTKLFSTNGQYAGYFTVWCKFGEGVRTLGIVIAPSTASGFSRGKKDTYMSGDDYMPIYFDNCRVPKEYIMVPGGEFGKLIHAHNVARVGNSSRSLAVAISAYERSLQYSKERIQFERPLCEFQGLQWRVV